MTQAAKILDGKWLAGQLYTAIRAEAAKLNTKIGRPPGLAVILVGDNPASQTYVRNKERVAVKECGFRTFNREIPAVAAAAQVLDLIETFNNDPAVDGILLQLPLPQHLPVNELLDRIAPAKDVDGLHPLNQGLLLRGTGSLRPCTPRGVMKLIDLAYADVTPGPETVLDGELPEQSLAAKTAVVVGRSLLVGKPVQQLLLERHATVLQCHSRTADLPACCRQADILVAAVGVPRLIEASWVKTGAVVIDVGINRGTDGKLVGDVDYAGVAPRCAAITPVPGGVGPMTIAMLMHNTLTACRLNALPVEG